ncbi:MAG TPA: hypothetical protein DCZ95_12450 [Verrucomicrobia bacterium]|nr:hypothetical protein [Verrucomicrobiota bacterium]
MLNPKQETFDFYGELQSETDKCWFVYDGINTIPIPKSQANIKMINTVDARITIPMWMAKAKGIV